MDRADPYTRSPELEAIMRRWADVYGSPDAPLIADLFSTSAATTYLGSAPGEFCQGADLTRYFAAYTQEIPRFSFQMDRLEAYEAGRTGWGFWEGQATVTDTGRQVHFRGTMVFVLEGALWRIAHIHNSNAVPNEEAMGYDTSRFEAFLVSGDDDNLALRMGQTGIASVMFTDIADSTTLAEAMGDTAWNRVIQSHLAEIDDVTGAAGGKLVKSLGDGTLCSFPSAGAALRAAQTIQRQTAGRATEPALRLRIGVHTGDVVQADGDYVGTVVNKAARVAALAAPLEIRVSDATRAMVGGAAEFEFFDQTTVPLKGLAGEHVVFQLGWAS